MVAVIAVTINRMKHPKFPSDGCAVVQQKNNSVCQFSWYCNKRIKPPSQESLRKFSLLVKEYAYGLREDPTKGSLFFHAKYVKPSWSRKDRIQVVLANHIFFKEIQ